MGLTQWKLESKVIQHSRTREAEQSLCTKWQANSRVIQREGSIDSVAAATSPVRGFVMSQRSRAFHSRLGTFALSRGRRFGTTGIRNFYNNNLLIIHKLL